MKKEQKLEQQHNNDSAADNSQVSPLAQNRLLSAALSVGNKLIAEFDGWKFHDSDDFYFASKEDLYIRWGTDLEYHSSWDWQIPVWGKVALAVKNLLPKLKDVENQARWYFRQCRLYEIAIFQNNPEKGQLVIIELLKWYNGNAVSVGSR